MLRTLRYTPTQKLKLSFFHMWTHSITECQNKLNPILVITYKYCSAVRSEIDVAIFPVNLIELKYLLVIYQRWIKELVSLPESIFIFSLPLSLSLLDLHKSLFPLKFLKFIKRYVRTSKHLGIYVEAFVY